MDRQFAYPGQIPLETDLLNTNKYAMVGLAKLAAAMLGTATVVNGLACVPTGPASLQVVVNPGEMYSLVATDASAYSSLSADAHNILKQGISLDPVTLSCPAPATAGQSINYLIQAAYQDQDTGLVTLPYYNASNPSQAWSGPGNSGAQQATTRKGAVLISAKAGTAAATGSQTTPAPDAGYTGLWVVTVANGQTTITSANISQATNAPILPTDLLHAMQQSGTIVGVDTGAANAYAVSYNPAITALTDGMVLWFKVKTANTGASTLNVNGLGASPLVGAAHSALQGGELVVGGRAQVVWRADISSWVLESCTGAALQVAPATQSQHGAQLGQVGFRNIQTFAVSGTFNVPAWCSKVKVRLWGGGGGGGGTNGTTAAGSGGNGGGYAEGVYSVTPGAAIPVTVGAAGTAGSIGGSGGTGGTSSFGALASATGGGGGIGINSGGAPGNTTTFGNGVSGSTNITGQGAAGGFNLGGTYQGSGGGGAFGTPSSAAQVGAAGFNGLFPGGAGGGAAGGNFGGGAGASGLVIVEY